MAVESELNGGVAVLTMDDNEHRNALSSSLVAEVLEEMRSLTPICRAFVLTGRGRYFSAGADIGELREGAIIAGRYPRASPTELFQALRQNPRPCIAAVNGGALGGGFELVLCCDLAVAASESFFALPELGLGVIPNTALSELSPIIGRRRTYELAVTRRKLTSDEAMTLGIVTSVVKQGSQVVEAAIRLAASITEHVPPRALHIAKEALYRNWGTDWLVINSSLRDLEQEEFREGLSAFLERRPADYEKFWGG